MQMKIRVLTARYIHKGKIKVDLFLLSYCISRPSTTLMGKHGASQTEIHAHTLRAPKCLLVVIAADDTTAVLFLGHHVLPVAKVKTLHINSDKKNKTFLHFIYCLEFPVCRIVFHCSHSLTSEYQCPLWNVEEVAHQTTAHTLGINGILGGGPCPAPAPEFKWFWCLCLPFCVLNI